MVAVKKQTKIKMLHFFGQAAIGSTTTITDVVINIIIIETKTMTAKLNIVEFRVRKILKKEQLQQRKTLEF